MGKNEEPHRKKTTNITTQFVTQNESNNGGKIFGEFEMCVRKNNLGNARIPFSEIP